MWVAVHYAEIGLKGKNRPRFEGALQRNLRRVLAPLGPVSIERLQGRLIVTLPDGTPPEEIQRRIGQVFGVAYFGRVTRCKPDPEAIGAVAEALVAARAPRTFGIRARRADKRHPFRSGDLARSVGARIVQATGSQVSLTDPELWVDVHVLSTEALVFHERCPGPGGLPVGPSGRVVALISGGIDSPVAAQMILQRGCRADFIHFHSAPYTSQASIEKVRDLVGRLAPFQGVTDLYLVPFAELQRTLVREAPPDPRILLYRRFMLRIATEVAHSTDARAVVTGESLGQVSSQTLANLDTIGRVTPLQVFRPLIGMDKIEIIERARALGTYEISIEPDEDCCSFLMPPHPSTWAEPESLDRIEAHMDVEGLVKTAVARIETEQLGEE